MPHIERTDQGEQYVLPGTERRTAPGLPYAAEADGQLTLHFYAPPDKSERRPRPTSGRSLAAASLSATQMAAAQMAGAPLPAGPAIPPAQMAGQAVPAMSDAAPQSLFGRRLAHFPHVFEQP
ncbi:hypothetical protein JHL17_32475 [Azospirillum sp. YIM B02556]|uniref:Uncharacterized protein n=1 Tax=Azospirillum endophyticum TaxID=2800326 RepID=A0ABS1FFB2_9PROT|nr:hypothetical protein [Azospirillum endophyticum]MBK1842122.1 hypothetical protein [Azospirillum endophyticum]